MPSRGEKLGTALCLLAAEHLAERQLPESLTVSRPFLYAAVFC